MSTPSNNPPAKTNPDGKNTIVHSSDASDDFKVERSEAIAEDIDDFDDSPKTVAQRLDGLKWSRWHTEVTFILGTGWALDAFETSIVSGVMSLLKHHFNVSSTDATNITLVWMAGAMIGALGFGTFADKFGRKKAFISTLCMYALFTVITAASANFSMFLAFRFFTAIGVAAEYTAVNSTISEFIPARYRGTVNTFVMSTWAVGALLSSAIQIPLVNHTSENVGWRIGMAIGAIAALFVLWARTRLPESPRWLITQGRYEEAMQIVKDIETKAKQPNSDSRVSVEDIALADSKNAEPVVDNRPFFTRMWSGFVNLTVIQCLRKYPFRCAFAAILNLSQAFGDYGMSNFLSLALLPMVNIPDERMPFFYAMANLTTLPAGLLCAYLMDKVNRKLFIPCNYILAIIGCATLLPAARSGSGNSVLGAYCFYQIGYTFAWITAYPAFTEIFPTALRASGVGIAVAFGRIAGAVAPRVLVSVFENTGNGQNVGGALAITCAFFSLGVLVSIPWYFYGVEGRGRSLEEMAGTAEEQKAILKAEAAAKASKA
ncbi:MFS general substrate transporter [Martensiomyces pterosporus]|nr:MFS general substrate transporter [Martensiomyces pterosporus]